MKKASLLSLIFIVVMLFTVNVYADSPITSTNFSSAYMDQDIVNKALETKVLNSDIAKFLTDSKNNYGVKAAVMNALGWNFNGKDNAERYAKLVLNKSVKDLDITQLSGNDSFCIGYLMALDDYFNVDDAIPYLEKAKKEIPNSYTVSIITALVKSQDALQAGKTFTVWNNVKEVQDNKSLTQDMKPEAVDIILNYMHLYDKYFELDTPSITVEKGKSLTANFIGENGPYKLMEVQTVSSNNEILYMGPKMNSNIFSPNAKADIEISSSSVKFTGINAGTILATFANSEGTTINVPIIVTLPDIKDRLNNASVLYVGSSNAFINNSKVKIDDSDSTIMPVVINDRTLVPIRFVSEKLGASVKWDEASETATIDISGRTIKITASCNSMVVNGQKVDLDVPAESINGRLFIPIRKFVEEGLNKKVFFDSNLIIISDDENLIDKYAEKNIINGIIKIFKENSDVKSLDQVDFN